MRIRREAEDMTPEAQRIAIAEACGWTCSEKGWWSHPTLPDNGGAEPEPPDYLNDLNAINEAEIQAKEHLMNGDQWERYGVELQRVHPSACLSATKYGEINYYDFATLMTMNAAQRAEAFLQTLGKWDDSK